MQAAKGKFSTNLSPEVKAFGVPFMSIVVLILIVIFAVMPLWAKVNEKLAELGLAREKLTALTQKEEALRTMDKSKLEEQFRIAESALPSGKEVPALLVGISRLYQEQGLQLTNLKITPGKVSTESAQIAGQTGENATPISGDINANKNIFPSNKRLDFDLVLSGTLEQARGFLRTLERSLRLMTVNSFSFTRGINGSTSLTLKISAPFEPFPPIPTDFAEALPTLTKEDLDNLGKLSTFTPLTTPFTETTTPSGSSNPFSSSGTSTAPTTASEDDFEEEELEEATNSAIFGN